MTTISEDKKKCQRFKEQEQKQKCWKQKTLIKRTWIARWSLWWWRQREQRAPFTQSKQYILHSLLCESAWNLHWIKNLSFNRGFNHGGHLFSSSSGPPAPYSKKNEILNQTQNSNTHKKQPQIITFLKEPKKKHWFLKSTNTTPMRMSSMEKKWKRVNCLPWFFCSWA